MPEWPSWENAKRADSCFRLDNGYRAGALDCDAIGISGPGAGVQKWGDVPAWFPGLAVR